MRRLPREPWRIRAAALAARAAPWLRVPDRGRGGHDGYFAGLQAALKRAAIAEPTLVIDAARLTANIATVREGLAGGGHALRLVTKSLPAPALLSAVLEGVGSDRMMVFNGVMLEEILAFRPVGDVLLGRPLPAVQVEAFVRRHVRDPAPAAKPAWLVDTPVRLAQYAAIARAHDVRMRVSLEIDVGLHRGGAPDPAAVAALIAIADAEPLIEIVGLMGYDAHAAGRPLPQAEVDSAIARYARARDVLVAALGGDPARFSFNAAGSPTWRLHRDDTVATELSIGSALVKPTHFDLPSLADMLPAAFIVQPVLKALEPALIPGLEDLAGPIATLDPNHARGFFLYGGYGDARPVSPAGLRFSPLYGGHAMLAASAGVNLEPDDFVFLRPPESEGILLQFGDIAVYNGVEIIDRWPTFKIAA